MLRELVGYWQTDYDWRKVEARLNALPQFLTEIDGLDIHFIHVRSTHENALPLIITHGWPGSVIEQLKIIDPLINPTAHGGSVSDAFHLVIPSMPGYGFSGKPATTGWDPPHIARAWIVLMKRLGYTRFAAQGGDWGSPVSNEMAKLAPPELAGIHVNLPGVFPPEIIMALQSGQPVPAGLSADEQHAYEQVKLTFAKRRAYALIMATRPQTLSGLADSPAGLAAWLLDHGDGYAQPAAAMTSAVLGRPVNGHEAGALTRDDVLDNITLYWLTNTAFLRHASIGRTRSTSTSPPTSRSRLPSPSSPARASRRRGAGPSGRTTGSSTSTGSTRAATSRRGSSRSCLAQSCARRSSPFAVHKQSSTQPRPRRRASKDTEHEGQSNYRIQTPRISSTG